MQNVSLSSVLISAPVEQRAVPPCESFIQGAENWTGLELFRSFVVGSGWEGVVMSFWDRIRWSTEERGEGAADELKIRNELQLVVEKEWRK